MNPIRNLSVIRKTVQIAAFVFFLYGGTLTGYYLADKVTGALPALSCSYEKQGADLCTLILFQHQMNYRLDEVIASGGNLMMGLMPTLIALATFLVLFVLLNKAFCGWICPLGTFQELLHILGQELGLRRRESLDHGLVQRIRPVKWLILLLLVFGFPLTTGIGWVNHDLGDPFCKICPSRILTTLATGDLRGALHAPGLRYVHLRGDHEARLGLAVSVIDAASAAGAESLDILTQQP